jgi:hypothetical protein
MATLEAFRAVLDDEGTPEIIRNHIIDSLQYTLRNHGQIFNGSQFGMTRAFRSPPRAS